jgi:hypothetical protein
MNPNKNPNCDSDRCLLHKGEVRLLPLSGDGLHGNMIVCRACFEHEMHFRREQLTRFGGTYLFPAWETLEVYNGCT